MPTVAALALSDHVPSTVLKCHSGPPVAMVQRWQPQYIDPPITNLGTDEDE
jgi:hypothetical protein